MTHETPEHRQYRRDMYISKAISLCMGADEEEVVKEAAEKWDKDNPLDIHSLCTPDEPCKECELNN